MAAEILLPPLIYDSHLISKMVFTPNPSTDDFLAAVICDINGLPVSPLGPGGGPSSTPSSSTMETRSPTSSTTKMTCRRSLSAASPKDLTTSSASGLRGELARHGNSVLTPPSPSLLMDHCDEPAKHCITTTINRHTTVASILTRRFFGLNPIPSGKLCPATCRSLKLTTIPSVRTCLGCCGGWLALSVCINDGHSLLSHFHPVMAADILLAALIYDSRLVSKMVFAPNPLVITSWPP
ncbi:unnamed protein product [Triticum turgidum subsp. durum]|uniref:Uncharacterized protein n=1 Tax=Triticum turgidum subsp. durum TaxID=4567 RepID=A0A9R1QZS3_TRITD|nr:unnamed protein product [Triticum turgidum subsp. durum]